MSEISAITANRKQTSIVKAHTGYLKL